MAKTQLDFEHDFRVREVQRFERLLAAAPTDALLLADMAQTRALLADCEHAIAEAATLAALDAERNAERRAAEARALIEAASTPDGVQLAATLAAIEAAWQREVNGVTAALGDIAESCASMRALHDRVTRLQPALRDAHVGVRLSLGARSEDIRRLATLGSAYSVTT